MKRLVFDLTKIPFLKRLISIPRLIVEVLNDQNLFTESTLANWFSSYVQFCSGGHFSKRAEAAFQSGKMTHLKYTTFKTDLSLLDIEIGNHVSAIALIKRFRPANIILIR